MAEVDSIHKINDRVTNKAGVSRFFDVELTTVNGWVRKGCPVIKQGGPGVQWQIDLLEVAKWYYGNQTSGGTQDPDTMTPAERKAWFESEQKRRDLQKEDRELIPAPELEQAIATAFSLLTQGLLTIPDALERVDGITPELAIIVENRICAQLEALSEHMAAFGPVGDTE